MNIFNDFISTYGVTILYAIVTALAGYVSIIIKKYYVKFVNDKTKKSIVKTCVNAVEQIFTDLHGQEKLDKCIEYVATMLNDRGIKITDVEIRLLIEAAVNEMNKQFKDIFDDIDKKEE